jgi:hypothetical protein
MKTHTHTYIYIYVCVYIYILLEYLNCGQCNIWRELFFLSMLKPPKVTRFSWISKCTYWLEGAICCLCFCTQAITHFLSFICLKCFWNSWPIIIKLKIFAFCDVEPYILVDVYYLLEELPFSIWKRKFVVIWRLCAFVVEWGPILSDQLQSYWRTKFFTSKSVKLISFT